MQSHDAASELSTIERIDLIAAGDRHMELGHLDSAFRNYVRAGAKEKLIALGDRYTLQGHFSFAHDAFVAAGATDKLLALGDGYLVMGRLDLAEDAYASAGQEIPKEKIITFLKRHGFSAETA